MRKTLNVQYYSCCVFLSKIYDNHDNFEFDIYRVSPVVLLMECRFHYLLGLIECVVMFPTLMFEIV